MKYRWKMTMTAALMCLLAACTSENPGGSTTDDTGIGLDAAADATDDTGMGDIGPRDTDPDDVDPGDVDPGDADGDAGADAETDGGSDPGRTIADYRRCFSDSECPVGLGSCIKEVTLNRADASGVEAVAIDEIFEGLEDGQGICTAICTESADACSPLSVNGTTPDPVEHVCQVVVVGDAPYPGSAPSFPFDDQLDSAEQTKGQPFGAICRPPFELDDAVNSSFCSQCHSDEDCAESDSLCWSRFASAPVADGDSGICLSACADQSDCPMGFSCDAQSGADQSDDGQSYCRPTLDTCTDCKDIDGDGFGVGRCGPENSPITPHDCDDRNAEAYFDPSDMEHAFPATCGEQDYNCNGLSDDGEQVGADAYPAEHCTACFDTCEGAVDNGQRACQTDSASQPACMAKCDVDANGDPTHADCDGDITNGCEVAIDDPSRLYYPDADGDGYGDPDGVYFACDPSQVPAGYVSNSDDCNDSSDEAWGGPTPPYEICDGLDNDCDGQVDNNLNMPQDPSCSTGEPGVCDAGTWQCNGSAGFECVGNILPGTQTETCDGVDNDCDGVVDNIDTDGSNGGTPYYVDADGDGYGEEGSTAHYACEQPNGYSANNTDCNDDPDDDNAPNINRGMPELCSTAFDDNCNGEDNEDGADGSTAYYIDEDSDGYGKKGSTAVYACDKPNGYVQDNTDCNDNPSASGGLVNPGQPEYCSTPYDDDCDGEANEDGAEGSQSYYPDADGDGYGEEGSTARLACVQPADTVINDNTDCNDNSDRANPGFTTEFCDGLDNNCNGSVDEGCPKYYTILTGGVARKGKIGTDHNDEGERTSTCGANRVWTDAHIHYYKDDYPVQKIDVGCRDIVIDEDRSSTPYSYSVGHDNWEKVNGVGDYDPSSDYAEFSCGPGEAIYKVTIDHDQLLYKVEFHCRKYELNGTGTSATLRPGGVTTERAYGGDGAYTDVAECGTNQVAIGARMNADKTYGNYFAIYGFELYCQTIELDKK